MRTAKKYSVFQRQFNLFAENNILTDHEIIVYGVIISILFKPRGFLNLNLLDRKNSSAKNDNFNDFRKTLSIPLRKDNLQEVRINWNSFDNLNLEYKNMISLSDIACHFELLLNLVRGCKMPDIIKKALTFVNLSSSFLIPLLFKEEGQNVSQGHLIHKRIIPPITEIVQITEKNLKNEQKKIIPINTNLVSKENFEEFLEFLEELSLGSVNMAEVVSDLTN